MKSIISILTFIFSMLITFILSFFLGYGVGFWIKNSSVSNTKYDLKIGQTYVISYNKDEKDPFRKVEKDTVYIENILNNYVLFSYLYKKDTIKLSCTDKLFQKIIVNQIKN
jgi:hypothetical protein